MNTLVPYGKHKDKEWSAVPKSYLEFCANNPDMDGELPKLCKQELERRNAKITELRVTMSAYDSASLCCIDMWRASNKSSGSNRGFNSFIFAMGKHVIQTGDYGSDGVVYYKGFKFVYEIGNIYPTLKHVSNVASVG